MSASSASATIGVTRRACMAGHMAVARVTPTPSTSAAMIGAPLMVNSGRGRLSLVAASTLERPTDTRIPRPNPTTAATTPITRASTATV